MLRSRQGQNPAFFESKLFNSTPFPRYKQVSCTGIVLPSKIALLNNKCMYVIFVTLRNLNDGVTRGNKIIHIPNDVTFNHSVTSLIDYMYTDIQESTLENIIEKTSVIHSIDHLKLFLNVVEFLKFINESLYDFYFDKLRKVVSGEVSFNKERVNQITHDIKLYIFNRTDWFISYERHASFCLSNYVHIAFNQTTHSFHFQFIGIDAFDVRFKILPFEANFSEEELKYNKLFMWLGSEKESWNCSQSKVNHFMPRIANIHERFCFLKIYLSFVERGLVLGSDVDYNKLLTIIHIDKRTNYFNLTESFVNISPYSDLLRCECIIKDAADEVVQFVESDRGTSIILDFK